METLWYRSGLFWALNALNVADAMLTSVAIKSGVAAEANPIVEWIGLPGKVALVAVAGACLARLRPAALVVPIAALGAIVLWTAMGLMLYA